MALQLAGLVVHAPVARAAIVHAIARDAWPALVACVGDANGQRGYVTVRIAERARSLEVTVEGAPVVRSVALRECVRRAAARTNIPPYEDDTPDVSVSFDLLFNLPPLRAQHASAARNARR